MGKKLLAGASMVLALFCGLVVLIPDAQAAGRFGTNDANFISESETVDGSVFFAGNSVQIEGTVDGNVNCAGETVVINGMVNGDVNCAAATVVIGGIVNGDVHVAGSSITISGEVTGAVAAFGSSVTVETAGKIGRDAVFGGTDVLVNGSVGRDLVISAETGTVNGPVERDVEGTYGRLVVGKDAAIGGFVHYASGRDAEVSGDIKGDIRRDIPAEYAGRSVDIIQGMVGMAFMLMLWTILTALTLHFLFPKKMHTATSLAPRDVVLATALGFLALVTMPMVAVMLMITVVGLPLGIALILAWIALCIVSAGVTAIYLGRVVFGKQKVHPVAATALAALGLGILFIIPILNILALLGSLAFGTGAVLYAVRGEHEKSMKSGPKAKLVKA